MMFRPFNTVLQSFALVLFFSVPAAFARAESMVQNSPQWQHTLQQAKGQTVYFYAWGGSPAVNDYLRWATTEIAKQYRVRLIHVKLAEPSEAVSRLEAENGRPSAIDLTWVNGENFAFLKQKGYLLGDLWSNIPNAAGLAVDSLPLAIDFGEPVDELEMPWGIGQFNLLTTGEAFPDVTIDAKSLLSIGKKHPGKLSYPRPPEFHGTTFLKHLLANLTGSDQRLYQAITPQAQKQLLPVLWQYLDQLHPLLWQQGKAFPSSAAEQFLMFQQNNLAMAVSFNPSQWAKERAKNAIPASSSRRYFAGGAITNSHYLAIPKTAPNPEAAMVVIQFLISDKAQRQKYQGVWGDPSVLTSLQDNNVTLPAQPEPHSSWHIVIEDLWQQRYGG